MASQSLNPKTFQMPSHGWGMLKRIIRAYGAAQDDEGSNVESVAKLAGVPRPSVSSNNNFLRSIGVLEMDKPRLTTLGAKLALGMSHENHSIIVEALQEVVKTTPIFNQLHNTLRARGSMDASAFRGQIILATGLKPDSPSLATIKALIDLLEESETIEFRDDKVFLVAQMRVNDNGVMPTESTSTPSEPHSVVMAPTKTGQSQNHLVEALLSKFPDLNPDWPDEIKNKWFDAFDRLMKGRGL